MDFSDTPEEAAFREEVRTWLEANVPSEAELEGLDNVARAKLWQKRKYDNGWACIRWPKKYGGREATAIEKVIFEEEELKLNPPESRFMVGQGLCGPTLMTYGTEEQNAKYLPGFASGEKICCQLFSEPAGGSDLAALRTRAERDGDEWVVNGQKIWTAGAHYSDYGILLTRTDPDVEKHKGLTYFLVDMKSAGIEIKPIKQISGEAAFSAVYFNDVRIPDSQRVGDVGQGWRVAMTSMNATRADMAVGGTRSPVGFDMVYRLASSVELDGQPAIKHQSVRAKLADWYAVETGLLFTVNRSLTALSRGDVPGPENSIGKLVARAKNQDMASFAIDLMESSGLIWDEELSEEAGLIQFTFMHAPGTRVAGGPDEILKNIIAERVLGMPGDIRVDKGMPFREVPTGVEQSGSK